MVKDFLTLLPVRCLPIRCNVVSTTLVPTLCVCVVCVCGGGVEIDISTCTSFPPNSPTNLQTNLPLAGLVLAKKVEWLDT